jgi:RNA polymerase sigma-70 factor (ECF subfamily)
MPAVSAFVTSVVRDFRDRDDVLQDIAVAVVESFESYDPARPFIAWAMGVARNQIGLYLRRRSKDRVVFDSDTVDSLATAFAEIGAEEPRRLGFLQDCMQLLEQRSRQLLDLRYGQDLKPAAIGELLEISANTVAKALQRIRDQLRTCIDHKAAQAEAI